jgi:hypothetical protein
MSISDIDRKAKKHLKDLFREKKASSSSSSSSQVHVIDIKDGSFESPWDFVSALNELFQAFVQEREPNTVGRVSCGCAGMPFETFFGPKKSMRKKLKEDLLKRIQQEKREQKDDEEAELELEQKSTRERHLSKEDRKAQEEVEEDDEGEEVIAKKKTSKGSRRR